jgi:macrolide transport system ATP-binding/permease protein
MGTLLQDLRFAVRQLVRAPAFTAVAVLSLALGIGANTTIFAVVNALLLHPLPVRDAGTLVSIFTTDERNPNAQFNLLPTSRPNLEDYARESPVFEAVAVQNGLPLAFAGTGETEQVAGEIVSGNFFDVLGVTPVLGRGFLPEEDRVPGERLVTVLSHGFWQRRLGGDPEVVGRTVRLNGSAFTVVGIAPAGFKGTTVLAGPALWVPMMAHPQLISGFLAENFDSRRALLFAAVGRLRPGVDVAQAEANLRAIAGQLAREHPNDNAGRTVSLLPLAQATINPGFRRNMVRAGGLLMTVVGLVLLIACANVANLLLARAAARQREVAVRLSLGASRGRLVRQLLTEGLLLAALAGVLGLFLAYGAQSVLWSMRPPALAADAVDLTPGARVLGFTALVSVLTALVFGLAPAWSASRPDLVAELKQRAGGSVRGNRPWSLRNVLVAGQVALCLVALVGASLFVRSLAHAQRIAPGFDHDRLAVLTVDLGAQGYDEPRAREFQRELLERARALPGVEHATLASGIPLFQGGLLRTVFTEGSDTSDRRNGRFVQLNTVEPGYLQTMGIPLLRGRDLAQTDHADAPRAVVVNETMAQQFWPGREALGQRFQFFGQTVWNQVVGVARDGKYNFIGEDPAPHIYLSLRQVFQPAVSLHLRSAGDPAVPLGLARRQVRQMDAGLPVTNVLTFAEIFAQNLWAPRAGAYLLGVFGVLSLVLAVIGIYGVMSYTVSQRTRELGVRMALGAGQRDVLRLVVGQAAALAGAGILAGLALALVSTRLVGNLLFEVSARDPLTFVLIPLVLAGAAVLASLWPAWRATRVDPTVALRAD